MKPKYLCFTANHDRATACQAYRQRYSSEPKECKLDYGLLMLGPIPIPGSDLPDLEVPGQEVIIPDQHGDPLQLIMF